MGYHHLKLPKIYCPSCSRKLDLLVSEESDPFFYICFYCKKVGQFEQGNLPVEGSLSGIKNETSKQRIKELISKIPSRYQYKSQGSQLRLDKEERAYTRQWLSLREYEQIFQEKLPYANPDFRNDSSICKWCGKTLPRGRRSFCKDSCSRNYTRVTFTERKMASLPYKIACRDQFYCQATGKDLAVYNRYHMRLPVGNGEAAIHHLIFVSENGSDHEHNLITLDQQVHRDYHSGKEYAVAAIDKIKKQRLALFKEKMYGVE